jgi:hypothetical protein
LLCDLDRDFEATIRERQVRVVDVGHRVSYGLWLPVQVASTSWPFSVTTQANVDDDAAGGDGADAGGADGVPVGVGSGDATGTGDPNGIGETCGPGAGLGEATARTGFALCGVSADTPNPPRLSARNAPLPIRTRRM